MAHFPHDSWPTSGSVRRRQPSERAAVPRDGPSRRGRRASAHPRRHGQLRRRPAEQRRPGSRHCRGDQPAPVAGPARLHRRRRHSRAARGHRRPSPQAARHRRLRRRRRGDHRLQRRVPAGLPGRLRGRRQGGHGPARLPLLPQRAHRARLRGGRDPVRIGHPLPADGGAARRAPPAGPDQGPGRGQPGQPDRHHAAARGARRDRPLVRGARRAAGLGRDLPRHRVRERRLDTRGAGRPGRPVARRSRSARSASTSR